MKVIHINQSDTQGGAAIAGYRLHQGLIANGIDSKLLVGHSQTQNSLISSALSFPISIREKLLWRITHRLSLNYIHILRTYDIPKHHWYKSADIINLHNLHSGYFNYLTLPKITKNKLVVFTLHDMWSFTGHCSYSYDCDKWKIGCGKCPYPDTYPAIHLDTTHVEYKLKQWVYNSCNLTVVAPSQWLAKQASKSILNCFAIHHIPYGIDTKAYYPLEKQTCRDALGISYDKKVLITNSIGIYRNRKGGDLLLQALRQIPDDLAAKTILIVFGSSYLNYNTELKIPTFNLGYLDSDRLKSVAFSAADLFVLPTRADNLPLVLQESMACGTPMVSFNVGGVSDLVRPQITGYLAEPENVSDLSKGIVSLLLDETLRNQMSQNCRNIAVTEYSLELQAQRYNNLYTEMLEDKNRFV